MLGIGQVSVVMFGFRELLCDVLTGLCQRWVVRVAVLGVCQPCQWSWCRRQQMSYTPTHSVTDTVCVWSRTQKGLPPPQGAI